ncbi:MAG TPA: pyrroloquinoline quinone biosynthesis peptide chaperone PqqD [Nitrospira sp.]|nr:pyrroloquinoline quinone biosynthesis peptide chaperone PqqD [Nitrospira sp.]
MAAKARLRFDRRDGRFLLLYPERGLLLNGTAAEILRLCTGTLTRDELIACLAERHGEAQRPLIDKQVRTFLSDLRARGLIEES